MGTKTDPGPYNCLAKAEDDEPYFTVLARDPIAPVIVRLWVHVAEIKRSQPRRKLEEALQLAEDMDRWRAFNRPDVELEVNGELDRLRAIIIESGIWRQAPCCLCGFDGPGYFQPNVHECARREYEIEVARRKAAEPLDA